MSAKTAWRASRFPWISLMIAFTPGHSQSFRSRLNTSLIPYYNSQNGSGKQRKEPRNNVLQQEGPRTVVREPNEPSKPLRFHTIELVNGLAFSTIWIGRPPAVSFFL